MGKKKDDSEVKYVIPILSEEISGDEDADYYLWVYPEGDYFVISGSTYGDSETCDSMEEVEEAITDRVSDELAELIEEAEEKLKRLKEAKKVFDEKGIDGFKE